MHLRVAVPSATSVHGLPTFQQVIARGFAGGFLEKDKVVERVIYVAKHFEKVDPNKVRSESQRWGAWSMPARHMGGGIRPWARYCCACSRGRPAWRVDCDAHGLRLHRRLLPVRMQVSPEAHFEKDLGLDSLDVVELVMALEEEFGVEIPDAEADKIGSINDAVNYIISNPLSK